jgi:hypothetical protein
MIDCSVRNDIAAGNEGMKLQFQDRPRPSEAACEFAVAVIERALAERKLAQQWADSRPF